MIQVKNDVAVRVAPKEENGVTDGISRLALAILGYYAEIEKYEKNNELKGRTGTSVENLSATNRNKFTN